MSRFFFSSYDWPGILARLRERGHEIVSKGEWGMPPEECGDSWWVWMAARKTPKEYGDYLVKRIDETRADVFVLGKGFHEIDGLGWTVPPSAIQRIQKRGVRTVWESFDCPDCTPIACKSGILFFMDLIRTCCPDLKRSVKPYKMHAPGATVQLYWPFWDLTSWEPTITEPVEECADLLLGGSPYLKPTSEYAGPARRDIAWEAIRRGWKVEIWGPNTWLQSAHGGDPKLEPYFHGGYGYRDRGKLWRRAKVNCGTHIRFGIPGYLHDRAAQVGGSGRLYLMDDQPGIAEWLPEIEFFKHGDLADLFERAERIRTDREMAYERGQALRRRILAGHTSAHRADDLLAALGL